MKTSDKTYYKRIAIVGGIILATLIIIFIATQPKPDQPTPLNAVGQAEQKLENANADLIKSSLKVYYIEESEYPSEIEELLSSKEGEIKDSLQASISNLNDFDYSVRGDRQAYKFTYKSIDTQLVTVEGNYQEDYR